MRISEETGRKGVLLVLRSELREQYSVSIHDLGTGMWRVHIG